MPPSLPLSSRQTEALFPPSLRLLQGRPSVGGSWVEAGGQTAAQTGAEAWRCGPSFLCSPLRGSTARRAGRGVKPWSRQRLDPLRLADARHLPLRGRQRRRLASRGTSPLRCRISRQCDDRALVAAAFSLLPPQGGVPPQGGEGGQAVVATTPWPPPPRWRSAPSPEAEGEAKKSPRRARHLRLRLRGRQRSRLADARHLPRGEGQKKLPSRRRQGVAQA